MWITITIADLNDARVAELIDAFRKEELGTGQSDPMPRRIQSVVDEIRRCIEYCPKTPVDVNTAKIPAGLKDMAVEKIVRALKARLLQPLTDDEREAEKLYQRRLEQLRDGNWPVDKPDLPASVPTVERSGSSQVVRCGGPQLTRHDLSAL